MLRHSKKKQLPNGKGSVLQCMTIRRQLQNLTTQQPKGGNHSRSDDSTVKIAGEFSWWSSLFIMWRCAKFDLKVWPKIRASMLLSHHSVMQVSWFTTVYRIYPNLIRCHLCSDFDALLSVLLALVALSKPRMSGKSPTDTAIATP